MTYCVGMVLERGLVFMSDTRTNAGLDNISTFPQDEDLGKPRRMRHNHHVCGQICATNRRLWSACWEERAKFAGMSATALRYLGVPPCFQGRAHGCRKHPERGDRPDPYQRAGSEHGGNRLSRGRLLVGGQVPGQSAAPVPCLSLKGHISSKASPPITPFFQIGRNEI